MGSNFSQAAGQTLLALTPDYQPTVIAVNDGAVTQHDAGGQARLEGIADAEAVEAAVRAIRAAMGCELDAAVPVTKADAVSEVLDASTTTKKFRFAMRLRLVAKVHARKKGRANKPIGKARANLKPKPVVAAKPVKKRRPDLFAEKVKRPVSKRPATKIFIEKRPKRTAEIVAFPVRKPHSLAPRLKRAA